jgi:predicted SAM-dependent methyltransferase
MEEVRLNLGCGNNYIPGMINIDNKSQYGGTFEVDQEADIFTLKWKNNSVNEILLNHVAMYIGLEEMPILLKRWHGWLKKGGRILLETGNLIEVCRHILSTNSLKEINGNDGVAQLFGHEFESGNLYAKWAWTPQTMDYMFKQAGFKNIKVGPGFFHRNPKRDFLIMGIK